MKNKSFLLVTLVCAVTLSACGKKSSSTATSADSSTAVPATPKPTINTWTNGTFTLNLAAGNLNGTSFTAVVGLAGSSIGCACPMTMTGTDSAGACTIGSCVWNNQGGSDPGCSSPGSFAAVCSNHTYSNNGTALHFPYNGFDYN